MQSFRIKFLATNASILKSPPFNTHNALICIATCVEENCTSDFLATKQRVKRLSSCSKVDVGQTTQAESHTANTLPDAAGRGLCLILIFALWFCDPSATWEPVTGKLKMDSTFKVWNPTAWCPKHQVSGEMDPLTMPHDQPGYTPNPVNITVRPDQWSGATPCYQSKSCYTPKVIGVISPTCCWYFSLVMVVPFHPTIYDVTDVSYIPSWFIEFPLATIWETLQVGWMLLEFDFFLPKFRGENKWKWLSYPNHHLHHLLRFRVVVVVFIIVISIIIFIMASVGPLSLDIKVGFPPVKKTVSSSHLYSAKSLDIERTCRRPRRCAYSSCQEMGKMDNRNWRRIQNWPRLYWTSWPNHVVFSISASNQKGAHTCTLTDQQQNAGKLPRAFHVNLQLQGTHFVHANNPARFSFSPKRWRSNCLHRHTAAELPRKHELPSTL